MLAPWIIAGILFSDGDSVWITPPVVAPGGLVCRLTNSAARALRVRIEGLGADGRTAFDSGPFPLAPGAVFQSGVGSRAQRCRFTLEDDRHLRGESLIFDPEEQAFRITPAARVRPSGPAHAGADG